MFLTAMKAIGRCHDSTEELGYCWSQLGKMQQCKMTTLVFGFAWSTLDLRSS